MADEAEMQQRKPIDKATQQEAWYKWQSNQTEPLRCNMHSMPIRHCHCLLVPSWSPGHSIKTHRHTHTHVHTHARTQVHKQHAQHGSSSTHVNLARIIESDVILQVYDCPTPIHPQVLVAVHRHPHLCPFATLCMSCFVRMALQLCL